MLRTDYHTHTPLCHHAEGSPKAFVQQALNLGLHSYGISDHAPMPPAQEPYDKWRMLSSELPSYIDWIAQAKAAAAHTDLTILAGLECDWLPGIAPWIAELRSFHRWDYLIGSVHYLSRHDAVDDAIYADKTLTSSIEEDWQQYWHHMTAMIESGLFDIVGHIDLVKIWGRVPQGNLLPYYTAALDALERSGMAVEINTAGWHKCCAEQYPATGLLQELLARRIPIVINSDAHYPAHLSRDWEQAIKLLQKLTNGHLRQFEHPLRNNPDTMLLAYGSL